VSRRGADRPRAERPCIPPPAPARIRAVAALVVVVALAPGAARRVRAQGAPAPYDEAAQYTKTAPPKTRFRLGPLRFTPKLELRNAGRDSNVFVDPTDPVQDTSIVVRGSVDGFVPVRSRLRLFGEGWLDWSYFQTYSTERSIDPGGQGRAELDLGPFTLVGGGGALQSRQLLSIDIDQRTLHQEKWAYAGAEWRLTRRWSFAGGGEARSYRYDSNPLTAGGDALTAASLNRNNRTGQLEARYGLTTLTTAVASAELIEDEFAASRPSLSTTRSYRYLGGFEFGEKALLTGRVLAGMRIFPVDSSGSLPSYRGPALQAEVVLPIRGSGRLAGSALRDVYVSATPAYSAGDRLRNTYVLTSLKATLDYGLPLDLIGRVSAGFDDAKYLQPVLYGGVAFPRQDHLYSVGGRLLRSFGESLRIGVTCTYFRRVSTVPGQSYDRWLYGFSAELIP
jgi:hypothetical protein